MRARTLFSLCGDRRDDHDVPEHGKVCEVESFLRSSNTESTEDQQLQCCATVVAVSLTL